MNHKLSKIFWPISGTFKNFNLNTQKCLSKSQKLMLELGLIKPVGNGIFQITPIAQRSLDKCVMLITKHMNSVDGQKVSLSLLTPSNLWEKTGRLGNNNELFIINNRQNNNPLYLLSPTHEESVTYLLAQSYPISYRHLPIKLYQIGFKFRDELKPRFGLIRAKEFLMKDLYSFDENIKKAKISYDTISLQYEKFFNSLQIKWTKIEADSGIMGGQLNHEYHIFSEIGEDLIVNCLSCGYSANQELYDCKSNCLKCNSSCLSTSKGIEIGHTFLLKDKYSKPLQATFLNENGKTKNLVMGSYGIGISRLVASCLEALSSETELRWPLLLSPFDICIIPPKDGSKEALLLKNNLEIIIKHLETIFDADSILIDDRTNLTIGKRLMHAKRMGYPNVVVIGSEYLENSKLEIFQTITNHSDFLKLDEITELLKEYISVKSNLNKM